MSETTSRLDDQMAYKGQRQQDLHLRRRARPEALSIAFYWLESDFTEA